MRFVPLSIGEYERDGWITVPALREPHPILAPPKLGPYRTVRKYLPGPIVTGMRNPGPVSGSNNFRDSYTRMKPTRTQEVTIESITSDTELRTVW
jgi:hypothetical protein